MAMKRTLTSVLVLAAVGLAMAQHGGSYKDIDQLETPALHPETIKVVLGEKRANSASIRQWEDLRYTFIEKKPIAPLIYWYQQDKAGSFVRVTYPETGHFTNSIHPFRRE